MKKIFCIIVTLFLTACSNCTQDNTPQTPIETDNSAQAGATEVTTTTDTEETTTVLPEGMAHQFDDGEYISIDSLISPMNKLNNICQGIYSTITFEGIYPQDVISKLVEFNGVKNETEYADFMYQRYIQMYGENFSLLNEYISCNLLSEDELEDMITFYDEYFSTNILPEYAFVVKSNFKVSYTDKKGNVLEDSSSDYYIAYSINGVIYIDYFYVDTLDL